jgi:16S rRNA G527 N7-methylase RsmG
LFHVKRLPGNAGAQREKGTRENPSALLSMPEPATVRESRASAPPNDQASIQFRQNQVFFAPTVARCFWATGSLGDSRFCLQSCASGQTSARFWESGSGMSDYGKSLRSIGGPEDFAAAFDVSRETIERLETYEKLLRQWQKAVNLVASGTLDAVWHRHFADSAQLLALAPPGPRHWIDLGSGAGFPGLVIAILLVERATPLTPPSSVSVSSPIVPEARLRHDAGEGQGGGDRRTSKVGIPPTPRFAPPSPPGGGEPSAVLASHITLIESDGRKAAFLCEVVRQTGLSAGISGAVAVDVLSIRAESVRIKVNASLPRVICARALAPLDKLLGLAAPLSPPGTTGLMCKGKGISKELQAAEKTWKFDVELVPSVTDRDGRIAVITNLERKAKD